MKTPLSAALWTTAIGSLALFGTARGQTQWLVDDSGGADFTSLQVAIDTVSAGDVLLIKPGNYGNVVLNKRLRLLGEPPEPVGSLPVLASLDVQGASAFTLAHLTIFKLRTVGVSNRSEVDRCVLGGGNAWFDAGPSEFSATLIDSTSDVLFSRCNFVASASGADGRHAAVVQAASTVQLVQCVVTGATATYDTSTVLSGWGGHGLVLKGNSRAWLVNTNLTGGNGQDIKFGQGCFYLGCDQPGRGGDALQVYEGAVADLRGSAANLLRGGLQNPTTSGPEDGYAIRCQGFFPPSGSSTPGSVLLHPNGPSTSGAVTGPCTSLSGLIPPRLILEGQSSPGASVALRVFGQGGPGPGLPVILYGSTSGLIVEFPGLLLGVPAFINPTVINYQATGSISNSAVPADFPLTLPINPAATGLRLYVQAVQVASGVIYGSNLQAVILTW
jgi:hypothetical protein